MRKPKPPKTFEEVVKYIKEKRLCVEPEFFFDYFEAADWHDSQGKPVLSWKQKLLTWHRKEIEKRGKPRKCSRSFCDDPGVYPGGTDDAGFRKFYCIDHKPKHRPFLPEEYTNTIKPVPENIVNVNNRRNEQVRKLRAK